MGRISFGKYDNKVFVGELSSGLYNYPNNNLLLIMEAYTNGNFYFGNWEDEKYNGIGALYKNGILTLGVFNNSENNGISLIDSCSGEIHFGFHKDLERVGFNFVFKNNGDWYYGRFLNDIPIGRGYLYKKKTNSLCSVTFENGNTRNEQIICDNIDFSINIKTLINYSLVQKIKEVSSVKNSIKKFSNGYSYCYNESFGIYKWNSGKESLSFLTKNDKRFGFEIMYKDKKRSASFNFVDETNKGDDNNISLCYESKKDYWLLKDTKQDSKNLGTRFYFDNNKNAIIWNNEKKTGFLFAGNGQIKKINTINLKMQKDICELSKKEEIVKDINVNQNYELNQILDELNNLIGLERVKDEVNVLIANSIIADLRKEMNLPVETISRHLIFKGNPGTGKTTVARLIARLYFALGILPTDKIMEVSRADLVGQYIGHTEAKTKEVINSALGGVLFIDEAYTLGIDSINETRDFGKKAIEILLKEMEDHRDSLVIIAAGYSKEMDDFIKSNPGLASRFKTIINFDDYSPQELYGIFKKMCDACEYNYDKECENIIKAFFIEQINLNNKNFGNGRFVRNFYENLVSVQNVRLVSKINLEIKLEKNDFKIFTQQDVLNATAKCISF